MLLYSWLVLIAQKDMPYKKVREKAHDREPREEPDAERPLSLHGVKVPVCFCVTFQHAGVKLQGIASQGSPLEPQCAE